VSYHHRESIKNHHHQQTKERNYPNKRTNGERGGRERGNQSQELIGRSVINQKNQQGEMQSIRKINSKESMGRSAIK